MQMILAASPPSLVFKRWILVLTRELTPLPPLSPGCLPDCFAGLDILGHMLMRITLSEREDASTGVFRMRLSDRNITPGWKPHWPIALPHGWKWLYILPLSHICSLYAVILPVNTHIKWQGSTWVKNSFKYMDYIYRIFSFHWQVFMLTLPTATGCVLIDYAELSPVRYSLWWAAHLLHVPTQEALMAVRNLNE